MNSSNGNHLNFYPITVILKTAIGTVIILPAITKAFRKSYYEI